MKLWMIYPKGLENGKSPYKMSTAASKFNIENEVMFSNYFNIENNGKLYYKGKLVEEYPDIVLFRCYNYDLMGHIDSKGINIINGFKGMSAIRDKHMTHQIVDKLGFLQPKFLCDEGLDFNSIGKELNIPFVMKNNIGSKGNNVHLVYSEEQFKDIINNNPNMNFLYQEYIKESKGSDYRLYIVGDEVIGCVNRVAGNDDFRANISQGGKGLPCDVPLEIKEQSLKLAKVMGLEICSIDYLKKGEDYYFCEGNGVAAFLAFTRLGYKMQESFMKYISENYKNIENKLNKETKKRPR